MNQNLLRKIRSRSLLSRSHRSRRASHSQTDSTGLRLRRTRRATRSGLVPASLLHRRQICTRRTWCGGCVKKHLRQRTARSWRGSSGQAWSGPERRWCSGWRASPRAWCGGSRPTWRSRRRDGRGLTARTTSSRRRCARRCSGCAPTNSVRGTAPPRPARPPRRLTAPSALTHTTFRSRPPPIPLLPFVITSRFRADPVSRRRFCIPVLPNITIVTLSSDRFDKSQLYRCDITIVFSVPWSSRASLPAAPPGTVRWQHGGRCGRTGGSGYNRTQLYNYNNKTKIVQFKRIRQTYFKLLKGTRTRFETSTSIRHVRR